MKTWTLRPLFLTSGLFVGVTMILAAEEPPANKKGADKAATPKEAVDKGLAWLLKQQNKDGSFGPRRDQDPFGPKPKGDRGASWIDPLCVWLLAMHAADNKPEYAKAVEQGLAFVTKTKLIPKEAGHGGPSLDIYPHAYYALAMAKLQAKTQNKELSPLLKQSVELILKRQKPIGGWNYSGPADDTQNTVLTGTALYALALAQKQGIDVPVKVLEQGRAALKTAYDEKSGGFRYGSAGKDAKVRPDSQRAPNVGRTGAAVAALLIAGDGRSKEANTGLEFLQKQFDGKPYFDHFMEDGKPAGLPYHAAKPLGLFHAALALGIANEEAQRKAYAKLVEGLLKDQQENGSFHIGDELLKPRTPAHQDLARLRDTCLGLVALSVLEKDALATEKSLLLKKKD